MINITNKFVNYYLLLDFIIRTFRTFICITYDLQCRLENSINQNCINSCILSVYMTLPILVNEYFEQINNTKHDDCILLTFFMHTVSNIQSIRITQFLASIRSVVTSATRDTSNLNYIIQQWLINFILIYESDIFYIIITSVLSATLIM